MSVDAPQLNTTAFDAFNVAWRFVGVLGGVVSCGGGAFCVDAVAALDGTD